MNMDIINLCKLSSVNLHKLLRLTIQEHFLDNIYCVCVVLVLCKAFSSRLGYEEHIPGQTRDWNEELQTTKELPRKTLPERLLRERAIFKVHYLYISYNFVSCYDILKFVTHCPTR